MPYGGLVECVPFKVHVVCSACFDAYHNALIRTNLWAHTHTMLMFIHYKLLPCL